MKERTLLCEERCSFASFVCAVALPRKRKGKTVSIIKQKKMNAILKDYKKQIHQYFGKVKHTVRILVCSDATIVDIEYTDFLNEEHVTQAVRKIIGHELKLNVKRECSESLREKIMKQPVDPADPWARNKLIASYEE